VNQGSDLSGKPILKVAGLTKRYSNGRGIQDVSMEVPAGSVYVLAGPNGSGKTTLLSSLVGLLRPSGGSIHWRGESVPLDRHHPRRGLGFVSDNAYLDADLTPAQWCEWVAGLKGVATPADAIARAKALGLDPEFLGQLIADLSLGTRKKVAIWAELITTDDLLILDEPYGSLDPLSIDALHDALRSYASDGGSVLFSTHLLREVESVATHVGILREGRMVVEGDVKAICAERPIASFFRDTITAAERESAGHRE
jgi:ABC-2 type transport system ATP-binding protein